jgi:hypothetical protein
VERKRLERGAYKLQQGMGKRGLGWGWRGWEH